MSEALTLEQIKEQPYFHEMITFINQIYEKEVVFPPRKDVFRAFKMCPFDKVKVVIIGQDPYHEKHQANGLAFSVNSGVPLPPSLLNIYREIEIEFGTKMKPDGDLTYLAKQGVLLLNAYLTVKESTPLSHSFKFYESFLDDVMRYLDTINRPIVFLLWGSFARRYATLVTNKNHCVIETVHPSPLSANRGGWFYKNQFKRANEFLEKNGVTPIVWNN